MTATNSLSSPFQMQERIHLPKSQDESPSRRVKVELSMQWSKNQLLHPFGKLEQAVFGWSNHADNITEENSIFSKVTMSVTSQPLSSLPPGFGLQIQSARKLSIPELQSLTHHWMDHRFVTTPLEKGIWDVISENNHFRYHLLLPTNGAAWSADALHQTFGILPCSQFMGKSAMEWSQLLVEGNTSDKEFWVQVENDARTRSVTVGVALDVLDDKTFRNLHTSFSDVQASCPWATRVIVDEGNRLSSDIPLHGKVEQVTRRSLSAVASHRLETYWSLEHVDSSYTMTQPRNDQQCSWKLRQKLPYYLEPKWQSFQVIHEDENENDAFDADSLQWSVTWDQDEDGDLSSVWTLQAPQMPQRLGIRLDYDPNVFLNIDDFPGDPNRGFELPPAMATVTCSTSSVPQYFFSNSLLILPPVPDMSMPFNVLSLSCSLYAYLIGAILTLLVRRVSETIRYRLYPDQKPPSKLQKLKDKIRAKFRKTTNDSSPTEKPPTEKERENESSKSLDEDASHVNAKQDHGHEQKE